MEANSAATPVEHAVHLIALKWIARKGGPPKDIVEREILGKT